MNKINRFLKRPVFRQGAYVLIDQGLMSVGMFMVGVFVARATSKEEYGVYILGWSFISIAMGIHRAMVVLPFTIFSPKMKRDECDIYQNSGITHTVVIGVISIIMLWAWLMWSKDGTGSPQDRMAETLPLLSLITIPLLMREYMRSALFARLEFIQGAKANILASLFLLVVISVVFAYGMLSLELAYLIIATTSIFAAAALIYTHPVRIPAIARVWIDIKRNFTLGKWILVNAVAFSIVSQVYVWLLLYLEDAAAVAGFGACLALSTVLTPFLRALNALVLPKMAHSNDPSEDPSGLLRLLRISLLWIVLPYFIWLLVGGLFSEEIIALVYSEKYSGYGVALFLLILKTAIDSLATPVTSALQALERPDVTTVSLVLGALVALVLGYTLIEEWGLIGACVSACVAAGVIAGWKWFALTRILASTRK